MHGGNTICIRPPLTFDWLDNAMRKNEPCNGLMAVPVRLTGSKVHAASADSKTVVATLLLEHEETANKEGEWRLGHEEIATK